MRLRRPGATIAAFGLCAAAATAQAAPVTLDRSESVAAARTDSGTGVCASVIKFINQPQPLSMISQAEGLLDRQSGDPSIVGRTSRLFPSLNLSVGFGSEGDFTGPSNVDAIFPYCQDGSATPMGADDNNIAMRVRGYLNVTAAMTGTTQTLVIKCDDACVVRLGKSRQLVTQADDDSVQYTGRRARWVTFRDPGLYPIEIVYFQNATTGFFELSRANMSVFSGDDVAVDNVQWGQQSANLKPLEAADLYSAVTGANAGCTECSTGTSCAAGSYCGDGLCQTCNTAEHCGATCQACATGATCESGACVQMRTPCTTSSDCSGGQECDPQAKSCVPPTACTSDADCASLAFPATCNTQLKVCAPKAETGCGCRVPGARQLPDGRSLLPWTALMLLALWRMRRQKQLSQGADR